MESYPVARRVQGTPAAPLAAFAPSPDQIRLRQWQGLLELQEQQLANQFENQRRRILLEEVRLEAQARSRARERRGFTEVRQRELDRLETAKKELQRQLRDLQKERRQLRAERIQLRNQWARRWKSEAARLAKKEAALATAKQALLDQRLAANGEIELIRRQLEAGWSELRRQQQEGRECRQQQEARLEEQRQALALQQKAHHEAEEHWEQRYEQERLTQRARLQEFDGLENRIRNYRQKLASLQEHAVDLEASLCGFARDSNDSLGPPGPQEGASVAPTRPTAASRAEALPTWLTEIARDLADGIDCLAENRNALLRLKQLFQWDWDAALKQLREREDQLRRREEALIPREEALAQAEQRTQRRSVEIAWVEQQFQCREAQLARLGSRLQCQRKRHLAIVRARAVALRDQHRMIRRLHQQWAGERLVEAERYRRLQTACEVARRRHLQLSETYRQRLTQMETQQRLLIESELVLGEVQQRLVGELGDHVAADQLLERRRLQWARLAARPIRTARRQRRQLEARARRLESYRRYLLRETETLERERLAGGQLHTRLQVENLTRESERTRRTQELRSLREERARLEEHNRDLHEQLERLVLLLTENDRPDPPLALAA